MQQTNFEVAGERLVGQHHAPSGAAAGAIVLVHGFNSSGAEFGKLPANLAAAGFHALVFDQRGYGASAGQAGHTSVERAVDDIVGATEHLRTLVGGTARVPFGIVGHSLGADYALAAMGRTTLFRACVAAHPFDRLMDELNPVERAGYHVMGKFAQWRMRRGHTAPTIPYKNSYETLFESPDSAAKAREDGFLLGRVSLANYRPAIEMSATTWAKDVAAPTLVIASPHDRAVKPAHIRAVYDALAGPKAWLEHNGGHSCFRDIDGDVLTQASIGWFERHLGQT